jgi:hypothetical protein
LKEPPDEFLDELVNSKDEEIISTRKQEKSYEEIAQELQDSLPNGCHLVVTRELEDIVLTFNKDCPTDEATMRSVLKAINHAFKQTEKSKVPNLTFLRGKE